MPPDPTDAEIQTGADAIARSWRVLSHSSRRHLAKLVLVAVLPDHDARLAEEIAQAIEVSQGDRCPTCRGKPASQGWRGTRRTGRCGGGHTWQVATWPAPAAIARQHAARPITDWHGAAPDAHDGSKWGTPARCRSRIRSTLDNTPRIDACTRDAGHTGRHRSGGHEWTDTAPGAFLPRQHREETP